MTAYERLYRRAEVHERWANIYLGKTTHGEWVRLGAAQDRFAAEVIKAFKIEEIADWLTRKLERWA